MSQFPQVSAYSQAIMTSTAGLLKTCQVEEFIPSRVTPYKIFTYGVGSFAAIYKFRRGNQFYAMRCFLSGAQDISARYRALISYYNREGWPSFLVKTHLMEEELLIQGNRFPILEMEWVDGLHINDFVRMNLGSLPKLEKLSNKLFEMQHELQAKGIFHGDIQSGNILVTELVTGDLTLKLIDYDNMLIPGMNMECQEMGRSEFQHPKRNKASNSLDVDAFSFKVMQLGIATAKVHPEKWNRIQHKGYNTLENFLFVAEDFLSPPESPLFNFLLSSKDDRIKTLANELIYMCGDSLPFSGNPSQRATPSPNRFPRQDNRTEHLNEEVITITSNVAASVLIPPFKNIGKTPCSVPLRVIPGKKLFIVHKGKSIPLELKSNQKSYNVDF